MNIHIQETSPRYKNFHIRFEAELYDWLKAEAKRNRRSISAEIILAVEAWKQSKEICINKKGETNDN